MSTINVIARTQRIVVDPASRSVAVINMGPQGPLGDPAYYLKSDGSIAMTGPLVLPGDPDLDLEAAPKQYVDDVADTKVNVIGDFFRSATITLNDDQSCYLDFSGAVTGAMAMIISNLGASGMATVFFRASGDANSSSAIVSSVGSTWTSSAPSANGLTGTTGTDGHQTVRALNFGTNRLYIENRTGSQKTYSICLFGADQPFTLTVYVP